MLTSAALAAFVACGTLHRTYPPDAVAGYYSCCWESNVLEVCGHRERLYVRPNEEFRARYERLRSEDRHAEVRVFVVVEGARGPAGSFGHMGSSQHEFTVARVHAMKRASGDECQRWRPTSGG